MCEDHDRQGDRSMASDWGLLLIRLVIGFLLFGHGTQKLFGWFGGPGLSKTISGMESHMRLRPAALWSTLAGLTEAGGGVLFALGLLHPLGSLGIMASMIMAILLAHREKLWAQNGGMELPLSYLVVAVAVGLIGPGAYSLDAVLRIALPQPITGDAGTILVLLGVALALATRAPRQSATPSGA
jgi:putative oxidoreductase